MKTQSLIALMLICIIPCFTMVHKIGGYDTPNETYSVKVMGNLAYVADGFTGLLIFDIANPQNPILLGQSIPFNHARDVAVQGNYAYLPCQQPGLLIFDISNPVNPVLLGSYDAPNTANSVEVIGDFAYLAGYDSGLLIVNIANPESPFLFGSYDTPYSANVVKVENNVAYISDASTGLIVVDVSNPQFPQLLGTYSIGWSNDLAISNGLLYVLGGMSVHVYNISNPQNLQLQGSYTLQYYPISIHVVTDKAYISFNNADLDAVGLMVLDVSDPQNMQPLDMYETVENQFVNSCDVVNNTIFLASGGCGLQILERLNTPNPALLGAYLTNEYIRSFGISNGIAYITSPDSGLISVDVSNPQTPQFIGSFTTDGVAADIDIVNNLAYVTNNPGSMQIIDIINPLSPVLVGSYGDSLSSGGKIEVVGAKAYICSYQLMIVDVQNPQNPQLSGTVSFPGGWGVSDLVVQNNIAYAVVDYGYGASRLFIVNVSNPQNPQILGNYLAPYFISSVAVAGDFAYISLGMTGMQVINIANPNSPVLISTILPQAASRIQRLYLKDNLLFVSDLAWNQIDVYDVTNPLEPSLIQQFSWNLETREMYLENGILYTANGFFGLNILDYNAFVHSIDPILPVPTGIYISNYPNPFNPSTTIRFKNQQAGTVHLDIYNIKGQKVKSLLNEYRISAMHEIAWNGKDDSGAEISSGIYYARISINGKHSVKKMVLIK